MGATMDLLNHPLIAERYFFPRRQEPREPLDFQGSDGTRLRCYQSAPHPRAKTFVHFHGNGELITDYLGEYVQAINGMGVNVLLVEYRGYGGSGGETRLGEMLQDVASVREQCGLSSADTIVYGRSVGAIFAVEWVAQAPDIAGLILESGVADPAQRLLIRMSPQELGVEPQAFSQVCDQLLNHQKKLSAYKGPLLVLHAEGDSLVEASHARAHFGWSVSEPKELVLFPRGDHNTVLSANLTEYYEHLRKFIQSL